MRASDMYLWRKVSEYKMHLMLSILICEDLSLFVFLIILQRIAIYKIHSDSSKFEKYTAKIKSTPIPSLASSAISKKRHMVNYL